MIDRLTWSKRWAVVCERITVIRQALPPASDEQIDQTVESVRREKPLLARSFGATEIIYVAEFFRRVSTGQGGRTV